MYSGGWDVGRIYQTRGGPDSLRWFWSLTVNGPMTCSDRVAIFGGGQGAISEELGRLEGVGEAGRGAVKTGPPGCCHPSGPNLVAQECKLAG